MAIVSEPVRPLIGNILRYIQRERKTRALFSFSLFHLLSLCQEFVGESVVGFP
ncbi:hypothetical protein NTE_00312 [Candidatus Nitrososphaera evergladensis SR1]|uniref:Uncharacterized protein n=1 Tax=Candidatus Nitrososphaera evergladensis SR1 TaxID=1459636 RepID=A0A075MSR6_9ARCH|nr:hypothetical protein NTE_00312 [Candidatus Nitrososphaera evergladensis SR1]